MMVVSTSVVFVQEHCSWILQELEKQCVLGVSQEQKGLSTHKLKTDVVTRWGSSYEMVERLMEQMEAVQVVLVSDRKSSLIIPRGRIVIFRFGCFEAT